MDRSGVDLEIAASKNWYVVQCRARQEARALEHLSRQAFTCYLPRLKRERVNRGKKEMVEETLFPGYVFIQMGPQDDWSTLRSTRGVLRVVAFGPHPTPVRDELIESIRQHEVTQQPEALNPGDRLIINQAGFEGLAGLFVAMDGEQRVIVLLNLLNQQRELRVPLERISKA
ncbi:transcription/translation regulatory transformer protein RfaH [Pseudomonas fluorescens]|uniref:Transcription antitermination protein RfaH n=1 Tax=Pseudomonas fluorescens TaxID=294 RepID=A0A5E7VRM7_PSEFL|nr:transcription/translation regulatory transformer protein RfaH [Pseudomonas fluorescens]VVQ25448.1 Transcription antitermination protein RfaH [Pseudomonas fluorescens]